MNKLTNEIIDNLILWGTDCENLQAIILFGSQARVDGKYDEFSDIDLLLIVNEVEMFFTSDEWLNKIGEFTVSFAEITCDDMKMRRVVFNNGLDADLVIIPSDKIGILKEGHTKEEIEIGYRVLIDKIGLEDKLPPINTEKRFYSAPKEHDFINSVNDFVFHVVWAAKKLKRGELWAAKYCVDNYMKWQLLSMIEHNTHAEKGINYNTWYHGKYMDEWANPNILQKLSACFSHYNEADIKRALFATIDLYHNLAVETAKLLCFEYPHAANKFAVEWVSNNI